MYANITTRKQIEKSDVVKTHEKKRKTRKVLNGKAAGIHTFLLEHVCMSFSDFRVLS